MITIDIIKALIIEGQEEITQVELNPRILTLVAGGRLQKGDARWSTPHYPRWQDLQCPRGEVIERLRDN